MEDLNVDEVSITQDEQEVGSGKLLGSGAGCLAGEEKLFLKYEDKYWKE